MSKGGINIALISLFNLDFGVRYISSFLRENGYPTFLVLFNKQRYSVEFLGNDYFSPKVIYHHICPPKDVDLLVSLLKMMRVSLVGISVSSTFVRTARIITKNIKKYLNIPVVWGGIHAIIAPEDCIQYADIVCIGEGEWPMLKIAECIKNKRSISGIENLWIKHNNTIERNSRRPLIEELDTLPFPDFVDRDNKFLIDSGRVVKDPPIISSYQVGVYPIMSSRGCINSCSFCCNSVLRERYKGTGNYFRRRSVDSVIAELRHVVRYRSVHTIRFWDDIFTYDKVWIEEFSEKYMRYIGKPFACYAHPKYTDRDILLRLKQAGLVLVNIGIQSGSERISKEVFSRRQFNDEILRFSNFAKRLGIIVRYDIISDNPYETDKDQIETVELLLKLSYPFQAQLYSLCWFPSTPLTIKALRDNVIKHSDLEQYTSKALNNFHMYIPLSKSKYSLFWNCIKAMAVNRRFPPFLVRIFMRNNFFKRNPHILLWLARSYMRLFTKFKVEWHGRKIRLIRKVPRNNAVSVTYYRSDRIDWRFIYGKARMLFFRPTVEYNFFLLGSTQRCKSFCLKVVHRLKRGIRLELLTEIFFTDNYGITNRMASWYMEFCIGYNYHTDIYFELVYPELTYFIENHRYKAKMIKNCNLPFLHKGMYVVRLKHAYRANSVIGEILLNV